MSGAVAAVDVVAAQDLAGELLGRVVDLVGRLGAAEDPDRGLRRLRSPWRQARRGAPRRSGRAPRPRWPGGARRPSCHARGDGSGERTTSATMPPLRVHRRPSGRPAECTTGHGDRRLARGARSVSVRVGPGRRVPSSSAQGAAIHRAKAAFVAFDAGRSIPCQPAFRSGPFDHEVACSQPSVSPRARIPAR